MDRWVGKVAVVTGASAGIGLETAKALVREGMIVVGLARRSDVMQDRMKCVKGPGKFYPKQCDVAREGEIVDAFEWIRKTFGTMHVLVNNAGVFSSSPLADTKTETLRYVMDINVMGLVYCTKEAIKLMKENGEEGHIVNISSVAGIKAPNFEGQYFGIYSASKFAVTSLTESLHHELMSTKIRVSNVSPGYVKTEIFEKSKSDVSFLGDVEGLESSDVAYFIVQIVKAPARVRVSELVIKPSKEAAL